MFCTLFFFYTHFRYKIHTKLLKQPKSLQKVPALEYRLDLLETYCNMKGTIFFIVFYTNFTSESPTKVLYLPGTLQTEQEGFLYHWFEVPSRNELLTKFHTNQGLYQKGHREDSVYAFISLTAEELHRRSRYLR